MREYSIRPFASADAIRRVGEGLLARTLPKAEWTHEAHLAACAWLLLERPEVQPESDLPAIIRGYNVAVGGVNDDTQGYHETLTQFYICGVRAHLGDFGSDDLLAAVNALLEGPRGDRAWPLTYYTRERLFSVEARRAWIEPDLAAL